MSNTHPIATAAAYVASAISCESQYAKDVPVGAELDKVRALCEEEVPLLLQALELLVKVQGIRVERQRALRDYLEAWRKTQPPDAHDYVGYWDRDMQSYVGELATVRGRMAEAVARANSLPSARRKAYYCEGVDFLRE